MLDYKQLRDIVSHRVTFDHDSGTRIVGYVAGTLPPSGAVLLLRMSRVELLAANGDVLEQHSKFSFIPNQLTAIRIGDKSVTDDLAQAVGQRVQFDYDSGARISGTVTELLPSGKGEVVRMKGVDLMDSTGKVLEHHDEFSFVPHVLTNARITEGPGGF